MSTTTSSTQGSSTGESLSSYFFDLNANNKNDIKRSIFISKKKLNILRICSLIYCTFSLILAFALQTSSLDSLSLATWSLLLQLIYFISAIKQFLTRQQQSAVISKAGSNFCLVIYELAFSFQLFNVMYYCLFLLRHETNWSDDFLYHFNLFNLHILGFVIIWLDQFFNMLRFNPRHLWFVVLMLGINMSVVFFTSAPSLTTVYYGLSFERFEQILLVSIVLVSPMAHFMVGYLHGQYKRQRKQMKLKILREKLIFSKTVEEKNMVISKKNFIPESDIIL